MYFLSHGRLDAFVSSATVNNQEEMWKQEIRLLA